MDLLTVLVSNNGATSGSGIGSKYHAILKKTKGKYFWLIELMQGNQGVLIIERTLKMIPQMVVPVFMVLTGVDMPADSAMAVFLMQLSKLKPPVGKVER